MTSHDSSEVLVYDGLAQCPYLPGQTARMPLRMPTARLTPEQLDASMAAGDRRTGVYLYRTSCPQCRACEAIRIDVGQFEPSRTQRRTFRKGRPLIRTEIGDVVANEKRVALFNLHRNERRLHGDTADIDLFGYSEFLVETCCDTFEIRYFVQDRLIAVALCDRGKMAISAVYCYFDPAYSNLSPGVFSILTQIELCRAWKMQYLYLGYYIAACDHMNYKAKYQPHERLIAGQWTRFER